MRALIGRPVFAVGESEYVWGDVLLAAVVWGLWPGVVGRARAGLALLAEAESDEADESEAVTDEEAQEAANEFRYARNLIAAEEMESWLEAWGLDLDSWFQWVVIDLLRSRRDRPSAAGEAEGITPAEPDEDLEAAILAEAACSGFLGRTSYQLAERAAVYERERDAASGAGLDLPEGSAPRVLSAADLAWLEPLGRPPAELASRLGHLASLDAAYERFRSAVADQSQVASRLRTRQTEWTRVSVRILRLETEDAAREALTSVRDDGIDMDEVASDAGVDVAEGTFFLEELDPGVRDRLLAAQKNELLGPLREGEKWSLFLVVEKKLPSLDDPAIADRAERSLLRSALTREVDNRVSWRWRT